MTSTLRLAPILPVAGSVTFLLFWTMTALIAVPDTLPPFVDPGPTVQLVNVRTAQPIRPPSRPTPAKPKLEPTPWTPTPTLEPGEPIGIPYGPGEATPLVAPRPGPVALPSDGDAIPLVRVPPRYPARALSRGVEGRVLIGFGVDRAGRVTDAQVLAAEPEGIFDEAALDAVSQWRYEPRVVNGRPAERRGLRIAIPFRVDGR